MKLLAFSFYFFHLDREGKHMSVAECSYTKASHHHMYVYMFNGMFVKKVGLVIS